MSADRRAKGLFWDRAWKLVEGCSKVSPGCDNCWSETETAMRAGHPNSKISSRASEVIRDGFDRIGGFDGRIICRHDNLDLPLRVKKPTVWAIWNDLYHEDVLGSFRGRAYAVMALCPQHTFLVLTKRAERMAEYWCERERPETDYLYDLLHGPLMRTVEKVMQCGVDATYPLPNVWHGVTAEDQQRADERISHLLQVPGKRFLSIEPMLGAVEIKQGMSAKSFFKSDPVGYAEIAHQYANCDVPQIHQVLLGGESGKNARPMNPAWARDVRDQCAAADVPFYFKQWGEWRPRVGEWEPKPFGIYPNGDYHQAGLLMGPINAEAIEINRNHPGESYERIHRVGKKKAGRLLDGVLHDDLAWGESK